jgi:hypothetical protein
MRLVERGDHPRDMASTSGRVSREANGAATLVQPLLVRFIFP